jgi:hypothetical protein
MMVHTCVTVRRQLDENTMTTLLLENREEKRNEKGPYEYFWKETENIRFGILIYKIFDFLPLGIDQYKMRHHSEIDRFERKN